MVPVLARACAVTLCVVACATVPLARPRQDAGTSPSAEALYEIYRQGQHEQAFRTIQTREDWKALDASAIRLAERWLTESRRAEPTWAPSRVAFLLELGSLVFPFDVRDGVRLLNLTRRLVIARPGGGGSPDPMDRFEVAIHRSAVAVLFQVPDEATAYLLDIERRLASARKTPAGTLLVARLDLARALLVETRTRPVVRDSTRDVVVVTDGRRGAAVPADADRLDRQRLLDAFTALRTSFQDSEVAAEASIRLGFITHRLGRQVEALTLIDAGLRETRDPSVQHWGWLFRGRALREVGRLDEAAAAYERALANDPLAQTAAASLAAVRLLLDQRVEAERWAQAARTTPVTHVDPWWEYWYGDQRFLPALLAEIRGAHP